jgi:hypothetical protein
MVKTRVVKDEWQGAMFCKVCKNEVRYEEVFVLCLCTYCGNSGSHHLDYFSRRYRMVTIYTRKWLWWKKVFTDREYKLRRKDAEVYD